MRTFVLRSRKGSVKADRIEDQIGTNAHVEIIAHALANAFFYSNGIREDVEAYVVLDSSADFPRTVRLIANQGLSLPGFHETAILSVISQALAAAKKIVKDQILSVAPGIEVAGFGFERLMQKLLETRCVYLLDTKGDDVRNITLEQDCVIVLSDHLAMPKNHIKSFERRGLKKISLGRKMLFASQCVVLVHHELDRQLG
ncbi:tRNA (pseudouridine(54)-N(1))-methyltransferase TrmY [soil metagenome]